MRLATFFAATAILCAGETARAEGLYYGGGVFTTSAESMGQLGGPGLTSEDTYFGASGTVGYRWDQTMTFFGAEVDFDLPLNTEFIEGENNCLENALAPHYCTHNATLRLRGIAGMPIGPFEGFASAGLMVMSGDGAIDFTEQERGVTSGYTIGFGLQQAFRDNTLRYEFIYDKAENAVVQPEDQYEPTFEAMTIKVSYLFN